MVGFGPGGALDVTARLLTTAMKDYASPFIVENRPGASERIALEAVKSSAADGSTLLLTGSSSVAVVPHVYKNSISIRYRILHPSRPFAGSRSCSR